MLSRSGSTWLLLATACQSPPDDLCAALVRAEPDEWPRYVPEILNAGTSATRPLLTALGSDPDAPGAQAALAVLGALGDPAAGPALESRVRGRETFAEEAALALGRLPHPSSADLLRATARDPDADATLRTACACAMLELGRGAEVLDVLRAVLLAGTPVDEGTELGFKAGSRWALERHMILVSAARAGLELGITTDSPWPRLFEAAETLTRVLQERDR